jgi:hypothetical protein
MVRNPSDGVITTRPARPLLPGAGCVGGSDQVDEVLRCGVPRFLGEEQCLWGLRGRLPQQLERRVAVAAAHRDSGTLTSASRTTATT